ncbi:MAG: ABC-F family ATP-binding cassette domain-containing protein [Deltaproteobacteria bacterium]|nr:ABC-F family ATP-binding cassette domain-containing protein [Deltaproteobacteria bacterium]
MTIGVLCQEIDPKSKRVIDQIYKDNKELLILKEKIELFENDDCSIFSIYEELGGWEFELRLEMWLTRFKFSLKDLYRNLISLLLSNPDLLLLDEPTNHLDLKTIIWLEKFLINQQIPYLIISHDREFLDRTTTTTWEIENGNLEEFSGNYSFYQKMKEEKYNLELHLHKEQVKKLEN